MVGNESCESTEHKIYRIGNPFQVIWGSVWGILNPQVVYTTGLIETAVQEGCLSDLSRNSDGMCQREKLIKLLEMFKCEKHSLPCSDSLACALQETQAALCLLFATQSPNRLWEVVSTLWNQVPISSPEGGLQRVV